MTSERYNARESEPRWQRQWDEKAIFASDLGLTLAHGALSEAGLRGSVELWADGGVRQVQPVGQIQRLLAVVGQLEGEEQARFGRRQLDRHPAELARLTRLFARAGYPALDGFSPGDLYDVLVAVLAEFGVYRAYVTPGEPPSATAAAAVTAAAAAARDRLAEYLHPALDAVRAAVLGLGEVTADPDQQAARDELIVRFGQTTGPVLAKGVEDTAFYRWSRLAALNEVGGDPDLFGVSPAEFHATAGRLARRWPGTMTTLSTHDTKRQEDVRARLAVLAEWPQDWGHHVAEWHGLTRWLADGAVAEVTERAPEPDLEYLMWQTLAGAWLIGPERLDEYLGKAMHEAKTRTSWTMRRLGYESAVLGLAGAAALAGFLEDGEEEGSSLTYAELDRRATHAAGGRV